MNEGHYSLLIIIPFLVLLVAAYIVVAVLQRKGKSPFRLIAIYAFPDVIEKKTDNNGATRWLLKDIYLEDGSDLLLKVLTEKHWHFRFGSVFLCSHGVLSTSVGRHQLQLRSGGQKQALF